MSDLDQSDHQVWMNPIENMYRDSSHHSTHPHHEQQHMGHAHGQGHVQAQNNVAASGNRNHYYTLQGAIEQGHTTAMNPEMNADHQGYDGPSNMHQSRAGANLNVNVVTNPSSKPATKGEKQIERAERKRKRERQRREDVNRLFDDLNAILAKIEKEQHELLEKQEHESEGQEDDKVKKKLKWIRRNQIQLGKNSSTASLNRAEVIARAVAVLEELSEERKDQRIEIEGLKEELSNASKGNLQTISQTPIQLHMPNTAQGVMNQPLNAVMSTLATQHPQTSNPTQNSGNAQTKADQQQVVMMVPMMVPAPAGQNTGNANSTPRTMYFPQFTNTAPIQPQPQMQTISSWNSHAPAQANVPVAYNTPQQIQQYATSAPSGLQTQLQTMNVQRQQQQQHKHQPGSQDQQRQQGHIQQSQHDKNHTPMNVNNLDGPKNNNVNSNEGNLAHCAKDQDQVDENIFAV